MTRFLSPCHKVNRLSNIFNPIRTGGVFHQAGGFLLITLEVINVHSRNLVTFPKI